MSYARFSSDGWRSDVYVYEAVDDLFHIHVAASRKVVPDDLNPPDPADYDGRMDAFAKDTIEYMAKIDTLPAEKKAEPFSGEDFLFETPGECADFLETLRRLGHHVPESAIEALREEEKSENTGDAR